VENIVQLLMSLPFLLELHWPIKLEKEVNYHWRMEIFISNQTAMF
jgi:hypothetical protein